MFYERLALAIIMLTALIVGGLIGWLTAPIVYVPDYGYTIIQ